MQLIKYMVKWGLILKEQYKLQNTMGWLGAKYNKSALIFGH